MEHRFIDAFQYVDDQYLDLVAEMSSKERIMKMKRITKTLILAAVVAMLAITAFAADLLPIVSLTSRTEQQYSDYAKLQDAMERAGFRMDAKQSFTNGFTFQTVKVDETEATDESGQTVMTIMGITVYYENANGKWLLLNAMPSTPGLPAALHAQEDTKRVGDILVTYAVDHYKFVPEDYILPEEEEIWKEQPGNFLSYGADEVEEKNVAFLAWTKDGVDYFFMDSNAVIPSQELFAMAEELF